MAYDGSSLCRGADYTPSYKNNTKIGTGTAVLTVIGHYTGEATAPFKIVGKAPTITPAKAAVSKSVKMADAKKKAQTLRLGAKVNSGGKLSYSVTKKNKNITFKNGTATLKMGVKKGIYSIKVKVIAKAKGTYASGSKTYTMTFEVTK